MLPERVLTRGMPLARYKGGIIPERCYEAQEGLLPEHCLTRAPGGSNTKET